MNSPNLSDAINAAITQSEKYGGVNLETDVPTGATVIVQTKNSTYFIEKRSDGTHIKGGSRFPDFEKVTINGSTFGGSMLKLDFIGIRMYLEIARPKGGLTTSRIVSVKIHETAKP